MSYVSDESEEQVVREIERLSTYLPAYLCERTGLTMEQIVSVLNVIEQFWNEQPHVVGRMMIFGFDIDVEGAE